MDQSTNWNQIFGSNNTYEGMLKILHLHTGISWYTRLEQRDPDSQPYLQRVPSLAFRSFRVYLNRLWFEFEIIFLIITDEGWLNRSVKSAPWYSFSDSPTLRVFCLRFPILLFANVTDFKIAVLLYRRQKLLKMEKHCKKTFIKVQIDNILSPSLPILDSKDWNPTTNWKRYHDTYTQVNLFF